jgi:hypothetical protein
MTIIFDDRIANGYALVADVSAGIIAGGRDKLADNVLAFVAEGTAKGVIGSGALHTSSPTYEKIKRSLALTGRFLAQYTSIRGFLEKQT